MKKLSLLFSTALLLAACGPKDGTYDLRVLSTNDVHGSWFDEDYVTGAPRTSLFAVKHSVDSIRAAAGAENVLLIDAGDCLQGNNAAYYFNYVDTQTPHLYPRLAAYMGYDAVTVGNHDIEAGHPVYDRVARDLRRHGIPFLAGNAVRTDNGKPYFPAYKVFRKNGLKVLVLGYTNANMKAWLNESLWSGMDFLSLIPLVQQDVDRLSLKYKPQVVVVSVHSGTGNGDGTILESQGLDLYNSLRGVDFLICSHDHRPVTYSNGSFALINSGNAARNLGSGEIRLEIKDGRVVSKEVSASIIPVHARQVDPTMKARFQPDFDKVKAFTLQEVGELTTDLRTADAFAGPCDYINFIQTVCLQDTPAQISFAPPLTQNQTIKAGKLIYNDMFSLYRFENQLFIVRMTGREVKDFLEFSYNRWIRTISSPDQHLLRIVPRADARYDNETWSFEEASYNFDAAAGINYTVDVTRPFGERIAIASMADGSPFSPEAEYNVAMTSYRASGGGDTMRLGAGIDTGRIEERVVEKYPEIRELMYDYIRAHGTVGPETFSRPEILGTWRFIPEDLASPAIQSDLKLLFGLPSHR